MTKTELEEKIKNGESVWACDDFLHRVIPYKANEIAITGINTNMPAYELKDLFATKQQAKHYLHHANVERVEKLPFLTWEEFEQRKSLYFIDKQGRKYELTRYVWWNENKNETEYYLKINNITYLKTVKSYNYTEKDFYKAYDECVRLFRGEV